MNIYPGKTLRALAAAAALGAGSLAIPALAASQVPPQPANLEKIEEVPDSGIKLIKPEPKAKITEKKIKGRNNEAEVQAGKSSYTVKADPAVGNGARGTPTGDANRGAMWKVLEFGGPKEAKEAQAAAAQPPLPPSPAAASSAAPGK